MGQIGFSRAFSDGEHSQASVPVSRRQDNGHVYKAMQVQCGQKRLVVLGLPSTCCESSRDSANLIGSLNRVSGAEARV